MEIREEKNTDIEIIRKVNTIAFGQTEEAELVDKLRKNTRYIPELSLVAVENDEVIGHILFTPVDIVDGKKIHKTLALAPMAVLPIHQNKGVGSTLVKAGFEKAREMGFTSVIVLGHPEYYPRFGFLPSVDFDIHPPVAEWKDAFFVKELENGSLSGVSGTVSYSPEFGI